MVYHLGSTTIGDIKVIKRSLNRTKQGKCLWECVCLCGKTFLSVTAELTKEIPRESCGCCEWHIHHYSAYVSWCSMKQRCNYTKGKDYPYYGGRGITYDTKWEKFTEFFKDMGDPPNDIRTGERMSLDRIDVNTNYSKENCKWSTRSEQQYNKQ